MIMRDIWLLALIALVFSVGMSTAEVPNLMGNWSGSGIGYYKGAFEKEENGSVGLNITEQNDRVFTGNVTFKQENGTIKVEGFAGAIGMDDKSLYMAEFSEGYDFGTIISDDEIELLYLQDGKSAQAFIERYHRTKS
jgi:hypothetical protein